MFNFSCYGDQLNLHSFPTRRSSDLITTVVTSGWPRGGERHLQYRPRRNPSKRGRETVDMELQDRKSTRLNSSHVENSYAVFCLKKKKKTSNFRVLKKRNGLQ